MSGLSAGPMIPLRTSGRRRKRKQNLSPTNQEVVLEDTSSAEYQPFLLTFGGLIRFVDAVRCCTGELKSCTGWRPFMFFFKRRIGKKSLFRYV